ncbi:RagB/SusD family nutrient uptake outer membrane protein [Mucilaginibacter sp.]
MKSYKGKVFIGVCLIILVIGACRKSETFPVQDVTIQYVFNPLDSAGTGALKFLLNVYSVVPYGHNRVKPDYLDAASDDAVSSGTGTQVTTLSTAAYNSIDLPTYENVWSNTNSTNTANFWNGIRYANEFINNIGVVPVKGFVNGIGTRYIWKSEARFLRAYFYFELVKRFGGVPLIGNTVYNINDNLKVPRNNFSDCITYIVNECNAIQDSLITAPLANPASDNYRATKGAALALKAKVLLYAASPIFNDPAGSITNPLAGYTNYDATRWTQAATAAQAVINLGAYSLDPVYPNIFLTQNDPEVIFIRTSNSAGSTHNIENDNGPVGFPEAISSGQTSPTQDLVNAFPMNNGLPITNATSGYDTNNPYNNRDPRLAYNVLYNGAKWLGTSLQTFEGGASKPDNGQQETVTGYYMNKFMGNDATGSTYANHDEDWVVFRYAEILLDYAEAENESSGPGVNVYQQLEALRKRAGIASGVNGLYGLTQGMTQAQMRAAIQNERRIEMPFEEQRYFDIRRWKIADSVMNTPRMGVSITNSNGALTYNYIPVLTTKFIAPKMYLYPIPYTEVLANPNLKQNPGW